MAPRMSGEIRPVKHMLQPEKAQVLSAFLGSLPQGVAVRLAKAIELDRLAGGEHLPHDFILDALRPILRRAGDVERTPTPLRLFCQPFQDLLSPTPRKQKLAGRIAISSINPVWIWVAQSLIPNEAAAYCDGVKGDILGYRLDNATLRAEEFWRLASGIMLAALSTESGLKSAQKLLGADVAADAREMALLLAVGPQIALIQRKLPNPTPSLTDDLLKALRDLYEKVLAIEPDAAPYVAVVAVNRLDRPWEALRLPRVISRQTQDTLIANTDMGLVGDILFNEIEAHAVAIRSVRQPEFEPDDLVTHIASFATLSSGIVKEVDVRRDGRWGQRLLKDRAALAEVMEGYMKRAPREILAALPTLKTGSYSGGPRVPDVSHKPDSEKSTRAMRYAKLLVGCRAFASAASFGASLLNAQDETIVALQSYNEDLLRELRSAEGERRENAEQYFELAAELTSLLLSAVEGEFLRRRGRAALGVQAAA